MGHSLRSALLLSLVSPATATTQSAHLSALESSAPVVEPTAGLPVGLASIFRDPTLSPGSTGGFFSVYEASYASIRLFHGGVAFRWGPRWSLTYASTEIGNLFDSSLINQDPGLASLRARALFAAVDALSKGRVVASVGVAVAADDNVGDVRSSALTRIHVRLSPFAERQVSVGVRWSGVMDGSIDAAPGGVAEVDAVVAREFHHVSVSFAAAFRQGSHWRYSETTSGYAASARLLVLDRLDLSFGMGRYRSSYGVNQYEWLRSIGGGLTLANLRLSVRYTSTALGLGSGYGVSLGYEPRRKSGAVP